MKNISLFYEGTMCLFLGNKAYQCAGEEPNKKARNERLHKVAKVICKRIADIDSSPTNKKRLLLNALDFLDDTKNKKNKLTYYYTIYSPCVVFY